MRCRGNSQMPQCFHSLHLTKHLRQSLESKRIFPSSASSRAEQSIAGASRARSKSRAVL